MNYTPLFNNILVKVNEEGDIVTPTEFAQEPLKGEVVACGAGKIKTSFAEDGCLLTINQPMQITDGDAILFFKQDTRSIKIDSQEYCLLNEHDVLVKQV